MKKTIDEQLFHELMHLQRFVGTGLGRTRVKERMGAWEDSAGWRPEHEHRDANERCGEPHFRESSHRFGRGGDEPGGFGHGKGAPESGGRGGHTHGCPNRTEEGGCTAEGRGCGRKEPNGGCGRLGGKEEHDNRRCPKGSEQRGDFRGHEGFHGHEGFRGPEGFHGHEEFRGPEGFHGHEEFHGPEGFRGHEEFHGPESSGESREMRRPGGSGKGFLARERVLGIVLEHEDGIRQKEIAKELRINPSSMSELIDKLESDGYLTRTVDPSDKRATLIRLTELGKARAYEFEDDRQERFDSFFGGLTEEERSELLRLLRKLTGRKAEAGESADVTAADGAVAADVNPGDSDPDNAWPSDSAQSDSTPEEGISGSASGNADATEERSYN